MKKIITMIIVGVMGFNTMAGDKIGTVGKVLIGDKVLKMVTGTSPVDNILGGVMGGLSGKSPSQQPQVIYMQPPQQMYQQPMYQPQQMPTQQVQQVQSGYVKVWQSNIVQGWVYQKSQTKYSRNDRGEEFKYAIRVYTQGPVDKGRYIFVPKHLASQYQQQPQPIYVQNTPAIGGPQQFNTQIQGNIPDVDNSVVGQGQ
jgi:hypothetical protein